jgi:arginine decarboxylase
MWNLKMLHFFINTGINDNSYYWNELLKGINIYVELKQVCPTLDSFNIGGGWPIKNSLAFEYDYDYMAEEIIAQIKQTCETNNIPEPDIFTEFGSYTVGESGAILYSLLDQKKQNDREAWNMIDSSFMTTLPDSWAINKRFVMLAVNNWFEEYERVFLGGLPATVMIIIIRRNIQMRSIYQSIIKTNRSISGFLIREPIRKLWAGLADYSIALFLLPNMWW